MRNSPEKVKAQVKALLLADPAQNLPLVLQTAAEFAAEWQAAVRKSTDTQLRLASEESLFTCKLTGVDQWRAVVYLAMPYAVSAGKADDPPTGYVVIFRKFAENLRSLTPGKLVRNRGVEDFISFAADQGPLYAEETIRWLLATYPEEKIE